MVVFTCHHCGDSIQKPKVEKHINFECKKKFLNPRLCCIDCLKDFDQESFVEHTKCVTEEERYSGKGFVPKASSNKNEKKQQSWTDIIHIVLKNSKLNDSHRKLLKALSSYPNVPRKQKKFQNFVVSSLKHLRAPYNIIEEVFKLIDDEFKSVKAVESPNKQVSKPDSVNSAQTDKSVKEEKPKDVQSSEKSPEKKDKLKDIENTEILEESSTQNGNLDESVAFEVVKKKKKKKKDNDENEVVVKTEIEKPENAQPNKNLKRPMEDSIEEDIPMKGVSKKKSKKLKLQEEVQENPPSEESNDSNVAETSEAASQPTLNENTPSNDVESSENLSKKERKKKKKNAVLNGSAEAETIEAVSESTLPEENQSLNDVESSENLSKKERKKKKKEMALNGSIEPESNETESQLATPEAKSSDNVAPAEENLSKKELKERKKRAKYEAELKAIETEAVQPEPIADNQENKTDENQKRKKKRKLNENTENEEVANKKTKLVESEAPKEENAELSMKKFSWEEVIRTVLEKADGNELSMKKLKKKVVAEYQSCHSEETSYEDVEKKFSKKVTKLPFVKILKDKVKLSV
ncbi:cell growth-regulating nucleolar protein [Planococcus citri]|uniref:cell growth-regulating nucleolar protein n=1 Tax=Planococcus citri TaxID=170843 RepID=UPI0031F88097